MGDHVGAMPRSAEEVELTPARAQGARHALDGGPARTAAVAPGQARHGGGMAGGGRAPAQLPVSALLGLHRAAGNAAVVQLLRTGGSPAAPAAGGSPAAPAPPAPREADRDEEATAPSGAEPAPQDLVAGAPALEEGERPTKEMRAEKRAEGEGASAADEEVATGGGGFPVTGEAPPGEAPRSEPPPGDGFRDAGRAGTARIGDAADEGFGPDVDDGLPHAFVQGGKTGTSAWGGGAGAGPHGNQESGSADTVKPEYDSKWGGVFDNASAWVKPETGLVTVTRSYVTSSAGDQGNGWYVTDKAAAALEAHEQKHVRQSREVYAQKIQPLLDRIVTSYAYGQGKVYKTSDAIALVQRYVDWAASIKSFDEDDKAWNGKGGQVDQEDQYSPNFPRQIGAGKVSGKEFTNRLKMPSEEAPPE